jgi:hypothetical protein
MGDIITSSVRGEQPSQLSSIMPPHSTSRLQLMPPTQSERPVFLLNVDINDANVPFPIGLFWNQHSSEILKLSLGNCQSLLH